MIYSFESCSLSYCLVALLLLRLTALAVLADVLVDELVGDLLSHGQVLGELHGELALALRERADLGRVAEHVVERDLAAQVEPAQVGLGVDDDAVTLVDVAHDRALELLGRCHLHVHDRLDDLPFAVGVGLLHGALGGQYERQLGRVRTMIGTY